MKFNKLTGALVAAGLMMASSYAFAATAPAAPSGKLSGSSVVIKNGYNDDVAKAVAGASKVPADKLSLDLKDISDADLEKIVKAFPAVNNFSVESKTLTSIAPLKNLTVNGTVKINAENVKDLSVLSKYTGAKQVHVKSKAMDNIKWLAPLTNLTYATITGSMNVKSIDGVPAAPKLANFHLNSMDIADLSPLKVLPALTTLDLTGSKIADLSPLADLSKLNDLNLYGATVADFTPLAKVPALKKLKVYASKGANYDTLGTLTQVQEITTGLTAITSLDWVKSAAKLKKLTVFAEEIKDYSPVKGSSVEEFMIWSMRAPVDFTQLKDATNLKTLLIHSCVKNQPVTHTELIGTMTELEKLEFNFWKSCDYEADGSFAVGLKKLTELTLEGLLNMTNTDKLKELSALKKLRIKEVNPGKDLDLSFLSGMKELTSLELTTVKVSNFDAIAACQKLQYADISKAEGITSLKGLKGIPGLKNLSVKKGAFSDDELKGFASAGIKITQK